MIGIICSISTIIIRSCATITTSKAIALTAQSVNGTTHNCLAKSNSTPFDIRLERPPAATHSAQIHNVHLATCVHATEHATFRHANSFPKCTISTPVRYTKSTLLLVRKRKYRCLLRGHHHDNLTTRPSLEISSSTSQIHEVRMAWKGDEAPILRLIADLLGPADLPP